MKGKKLKKIIEVKPKKDMWGHRYIPYCDYGFHQGVIRDFYEPECVKKGCSHFKKLAIGVCLVALVVGCAKAPLFDRDRVIHYKSNKVVKKYYIDGSSEQRQEIYIYNNPLPKSL